MVTTLVKDESITTNTLAQTQTAEYPNSQEDRLRLGDIPRKNLSRLIEKWSDVAKMKDIYPAIGISRQTCYTWRNGGAISFSDAMAENIAHELQIGKQNLLDFLANKISFNDFWVSTIYGEESLLIDEENESINKEENSSPVNFLVQEERNLYSDASLYNFYPPISFEIPREIDIAKTLMRASLNAKAPPLKPSELVENGCDPIIIDKFFNSDRCSVNLISESFDPSELNKIAFYINRIVEVKEEEKVKIILDKSKTYLNELESFLVDIRFISGGLTQVAKMIRKAIIYNNISMENIVVGINLMGVTLDYWKKLRLGFIEATPQDLNRIIPIIDRDYEVYDREEWMKNALATPVEAQSAKLFAVTLDF